MNGNINAEAARPRPLSGGIWTLFSWLRRDDHSLSSESLSSAGSDRTAVSFAFLEPFKYKAAIEPIVLPPLSPPTDSYRKRLRERNFRKQRERDITLHRKYGLFKGENSSDRYDAFSLPTARRDISNNIENIERGRRATSEIFQRRAPYVPGKRRAPLPPAITSSLPRNFSRKRPAPKPPNNFISNGIIKTHLNETMNSKVDSGSQPSSITNIDLDNKTEKNVKQEKNKPEKSFLKQIFDNRKRNSSIETNYVKFLPNISELDEQAAKIIENKKLKLLESNAQTTSNIDIKSETSVEKWTCPTCFKKYNTTTSCCLFCRSNRNQLDDSSKRNTKNVATNIYTQTDNTELVKIASTSKCSEYDEKKKLKEMLKEMKDSLPKRPKQYVTETPTLRIGSSSATMQKSMLKSEANFESKENKFVKSVDEAKQLNLDKRVQAASMKGATGISITKNDVLQASSNGLSTNFPSNIIITSHESKIRLENDFKDKECINRCQNSISNISLETTGPSTSKEFFIQSQSKDLIQNQIKKFKEEENNKNQAAHDSKLQNNNTEPFIKSKLSGLSAAMLVQPSPAKADVHLKSKTVQTQSESSSNYKLVANAKTKKAEENISNLPPPNSIPSNLQEGDLLFNKTEINTKLNITKNISSTVVSKLHTPLRISSLLNPVYNPIHNNCTTKNTLENVTETSTNISHKLNEPSTSVVMSQTPPLSSNQNPSNSSNEISVNKEKESSNKKYSTNTSVCKVLGVTPTSSKHQDKNVLDKIDHHSRRRELVNQLEKSIAKGDEQAAADAAIKLAKLRLSCSVLSFSSQIIGNTTEKTTIEASPVKTSEDETKTVTKLNFLVMPIQEKVDSKLILQDSNLIKNNEKVNQSHSPDSKGKIIECNDIKSKRIISVNNIKRESVILKDSDENKIMSVQIWVEDKDATRGPISIPIRRKATMGELRQQAETSLGLDSRLQRWIVGRTLCSDDTTPLVTLAGPELNSPFYLCVVETETKKDSNNQVLEEHQDKTVANKIQEAGQVYTELMKLEQQAIVPNADAFVCEVCMDECESEKGAVLRECLHSFCRECLSDVVRHCEEPVVSCPTMGCPGLLQDREIRALLSTEDYERWLARGLTTAECGTRNAFHCRTRDCSGWAFCEPEVRKFPCPVCKCNNCVPCQAIHEGETCERYQLKLRTAVTAAQTNETDESTQALLNSLIRRGEALRCPECHAIITKKWGCDWVKCSACKTEICWVTRDRRWGPGGRGDTSAGCKCGVDGKRCHPSCGYCH